MQNNDFRWSSAYQTQVDRNLGLVTPQQQEELRSAHVVVMGLGGIGGICLEILVRSGIGSFCIVDKDSFDASNLNRQIFAFQHTLGEKKIDTAERFAKDINPDVKIYKFETVTEQNVGQVIPPDKTTAIVMGIDDLKPCIIASRQAKKRNIPIVEGWALPYANVRVIDNTTSDLESFYNLPTIQRSISEISDEEFKKMNFDVLMQFGAIDGLSSFYSEQTPARIQEGKTPSFAPIVWFSSVMMATETIKLILGWGTIARGPGYTMYDPFSHKIPRQ